MLKTFVVKVLVAGVISSVLLVAGPAPATVSNFDASATANGFRLEFAADRSPVTRTPIDWGGPLASAVLDTLGTSTALASFPYPGDLGLTGPGAGAGLLGLPAPPAYPFAVRAENPGVPEAGHSFPGGDLRATAQPQEAKATAAGGSPKGEVLVTHGFSTASVKVEGDDVVASAESIVQGLRIGPLSIGRVHSTAKVLLKPDGTIERASDVAMENVTTNGKAIALGSEGLPAPGLSALPGEGALPADELEQAGLEVASLSKEDTEDGVVSAGFRITKPVDFGPGGTGSLTVIIGQVSARARGEGTVLFQPPGVTTESSRAETVVSNDNPGADAVQYGSSTGTPVADVSGASHLAASTAIPADTVASGGFRVDPDTPTVDPATEVAAGPAPSPVVTAQTGRTVLNSTPAAVAAERLGTGVLFGLMTLGAVLAALCVPFVRSLTVR